VTVLLVGAGATFYGVVLVALSPRVRTKTVALLPINASG